MPRKQLETLWTIGHSVRSIGDFISLLTENRIELLADVRRFPGSRRHPQFGQEQLRASLAAEKIEYLHFPALGGRRKALATSHNTVWRHEAFRGYADYMETKEFHEAVEGLLESAQKKRVAIMCAEALWWQCHRSLIADYLKARGFVVIHILGPGKTQEHPFTSAARIVDGQLSYTAAERELPLKS